MVRPARFERATSCSGGMRSIQLSYGRPILRPTVRLFAPPMSRGRRGGAAPARRRLAALGRRRTWGGRGDFNARFPGPQPSASTKPSHFHHAAWARHATATITHLYPLAEVHATQNAIGIGTSARGPVGTSARGRVGAALTPRPFSVVRTAHRGYAKRLPPVPDRRGDTPIPDTEPRHADRSQTP